MLHDYFWEVLDIVSSITAFTVGKPFSACFSTVKKVPQNRASFRKFLVHMNPESHQENFP
jgi:hypothetical protein